MIIIWGCLEFESINRTLKLKNKTRYVSLRVIRIWTMLLQYSCLENPMDGGAWWAAVHGVTESRTGLSNFTFTFHFHALEKEMATHSSVLAWDKGSLVVCRLWGRTVGQY